MKRRDFLATGTVVAVGSLAAPRIARAQDAKVLRFVPQANLSSLDSVAGTQYVVRNASLMVWETLYGIDHTITPRPQMAESHEVSPDFTEWTFKLRPGLKFHDGAPVLGRDVVASLQRWMVRDTMGQRIKATLVDIGAPDDRTIKIKLSKPFPKMLFALGKQNAPVALIMPERIAKTDPFKLISEYVGSGPMVFKKGRVGCPANKARVPTLRRLRSAARARRLARRRPADEFRPHRVADPARRRHQGCRAAEWRSRLVGEPDPRSRPAAQKEPQSERRHIGRARQYRLVPHEPSLAAVQRCSRAPGCHDGAEPGGLHARRRRRRRDAVEVAPSYFTPGTPFYTDAGGEILKGPRKYDEAKKLLAESGYKGEKIALLVATDISITKAQGDVTADLLGKIGMNVDYQALDWGTVGARRAKKEAPSEGGWNIFHTWHAGADCINPAPYTALDAGGPIAWFGWPNSPKIQPDIANWYDAPDKAAEQAAMDTINRDTMEFVTYAPTGFFLQYQSWRKNVSGVVKAPFPVFWDVTKT